MCLPLTDMGPRHHVSLFICSICPEFGLHFYHEIKTTVYNFASCDGQILLLLLFYEDWWFAWLRYRLHHIKWRPLAAGPAVPGRDWNATLILGATFSCLCVTVKFQKECQGYFICVTRWWNISLTMKFTWDASAMEIPFIWWNKDVRAFCTATL